METVGLYDILTVEPAAHPSISCNWAEFPDENTLTKCLRLVSEATTVPPLRITLEKHIPCQSGLGGASSDAAGLLRALQGYLPALLPEPFIRDVAQSVGSDVPFFLVGGRCAATGYGEILEQLAPSRHAYFVIAQPAEMQSTAVAYAALDAKTYDWRQMEKEATYNDFERVAPKESLNLIAKLRRLGGTSGLTGSGSAVFGAFDDWSTCEAVSTLLLAEGVPFVAVAKPACGLELEILD